MASSKFPVHVVPVPKKLIDLAAACPTIACNLRINQRGHNVPFLWGEAQEVYEPARELVRTLVAGDRVLVHFQQYGDHEVNTAVIELGSVFWTSEGYPRLDFRQTPEMVRLLESEFFRLWGGFILAIAKIDSTTPLTCLRDRDASEFTRLAGTLSAQAA